MSMSVDVILELKDGRLPLIRRGHEPFKGYWALPGGRVKRGELLEQAVVREIGEEIGLQIIIKESNHPIHIVDVSGIPGQLRQIYTYNAIRDPRGGFTTLYALQLDADSHQIAQLLRWGSDASDGMFFDRQELPELAFSHREIINDYITGANPK